MSSFFLCYKITQYKHRSSFTPHLHKSLQDLDTKTFMCYNLNMKEDFYFSKPYLFKIPANMQTLKCLKSHIFDEDLSN